MRRQHSPKHRHSVGPAGPYETQIAGVACPLEFKLMESKYGIARIDGGRGIPEVNAELQKRIDGYLRSLR